MASEVTERGALTDFEERVLVAVGSRRFNKPGAIAGALGMQKRKPQAYARVVGAALNRLEKRGLVRRMYQSAGHGRFGDWGWERTTAGHAQSETIITHRVQP